MKRTRTLCAALALTAAAALTACSMPGGSASAADSSAPDSSAPDSSAADSSAAEAPAESDPGETPAESDPGETISSEDGYGEGRLGDTMQTYFFDYTVNSAYTCTEFAGTTPAEGSMFLVADVTVRNTDNRSIEMYDTDFQAQWGSDGEEDFRVPITYDTENQMDLPTLTDEQLPSTYTLAVDEERTGLLVYEVPAGFQDFSISYQEIFSDDSYGDTFFVFFTAEPQEGTDSGAPAAV